MSSEKKLRFGIVGAGVAGSLQAEAIVSLKEAKLVAIAAVSEKRVKKLAEKYGVTYYTDYKKMLKRKDIDIVSVCTPSGCHSEIAVAAAEANKHVIVEKPIETTLEKANRIINACKNKGVKLSVISQHRFDIGVLKLHRALEENKFGRLILGDAHVKWYRSQKYYDSANWRGTWELDGGGILINQAIHTIDLLQWIMGPVDSVYANVATLAHKIEVEDVATALVKFKNGALGVIEGSTAIYPGQPEQLGIYGEKGTVILEGNRIKKWEFMDRKEKFIEERKISTGASDPNAIGSEAHKAQIKDIIEAIKEDREPAVTGEEGRKVLEIILAIYRSAKTNKPIKLPLS
ncbi:Gfo/Idh/MocA family oxidoreductase [Candidatus Aerophobetes bacterium]|nr:Gfo/Idh/MocA family oxidoreductase [Candidatus Aerophobetes bacterium]